MTGSRNLRARRAFAIVGLLLALGWIVVILLPSARDMMLDFAFSFLLNLLVTILLWWVARRTTGRVRTFWRWIALGWTLNVVGNLAWSVYDLVSEMPLPIFSWIDILYLARYVAMGTALTHLPRTWKARRWLDWGAVAVAAAAFIWLALFRPTLASAATPWTHFLGGAFYPILDAALVYAAVLSWSNAHAKAVRRILGGVAFSMLTYGVANWINFTARSVSLEATALFAGFFWLLADLFIGFTALSALTCAPQRVVKDVDRGRRVPWPTFLPYLALAFTLVVLIIDGLMRTGAPDGFLMGCAMVNLVLVIAYHLQLRRPIRDREEGSRVEKD